MNRLTIHHQFQFVRLPHSRIISMWFPQKGPARNVIKSGGARPRYKYPSWKNGISMQAESLYELAAFKLLDADPTVTAYFEQPVQIQYELAGEVRKHFPDILVFRGSNKELWEVKPKDAAEREDLIERTALMMDELPKYGLPYRMVIGEDLTRKPRIDSIDTLLRYGRADIPVGERERIRVLLERERRITWQMAREGYLGEQSVAYASRLMLEGWLLWNTEEKLTANSVLTWSKNTHPQLCTALEE